MNTKLGTAVGHDQCTILIDFDVTSSKAKGHKYLQCKKVSNQQLVDALAQLQQSLYGGLSRLVDDPYGL